MISRREVAFMILGAGTVAGGGYVVRSDDTLVEGITDLASGDQMRQNFPLSSELPHVEWTEQGFVEIVTEPDSQGASVFLAPARVEDPLEGEIASSDITVRGGTIEFGLEEVIRETEIREFKLGSYSLDGEGVAVSAERIDVVSFSVPDSVESNIIST